MKKLLIVEDDRALREGLARSLSSDVVETFAASTLAEADAIVTSRELDLIILDCNLPDGNGVDFCASLRGKYGVPVIFLTVLDSELDEVSAFRAGGCDYIKKPFSLMVLRERVNAALGRARRGSGVYDDGYYLFDFTDLVFRAGGTDVVLSATESKLLCALVENARRVVSRSSLAERVWGCDSSLVDENTLTVSVKRLRSKLGADSIRTVYGLGYMWAGGR